jgi:helix-turn-helix protein
LITCFILCTIFVMAKYLTKGDLLKLLRRKADEAGEQQILAKELGVSPQYLSDVLNEKREPGDSILIPLGLHRVVVYEKPLFTEKIDDRDNSGT